MASSVEDIYADPLGALTRPLPDDQPSRAAAEYVAVTVRLTAPQLDMLNAAHSRLPVMDRAVFNPSTFPDWLADRRAQFPGLERQVHHALVKDMAAKVGDAAALNWSKHSAGKSLADADSRYYRGDHLAALQGIIAADPEVMGRYTGPDLPPPVVPPATADASDLEQREATTAEIAEGNRELRAYLAWQLTLTPDEANDHRERLTEALRGEAVDGRDPRERPLDMDDLMPPDLKAELSAERDPSRTPPGRDL